jgi:hypothetical protein
LSDFLDSSPLKPFGQMNRNLVGSIYGRSSINNAHLVLIGLKTWPPQAIRFIWPSGFTGEEFKKSANQKQESSLVAMFVNG